MSKYAINDQMLFDYRIAKARATAQAAQEFHGRRKPDFRKAARLSDGEPPWIRKPRKKRGRGG